MDKIIIFGATGLIGKELYFFLEENGYDVYAVSRNKKKALTIFSKNVIEWDGVDGSLAPNIEGAYALINLAGDNIIKSLLTRQGRDSILKNRTNYSNLILKAITNCRIKPKVFLQGSGVGYYEPFGTKTLIETSEHGKGFICELSKKIEDTMKPLEKELRLVYLRTATVLSDKGGILPIISIPIKLYLGGPIGKNENYFPYIKLEDAVRAIKYIIEQNITGPVNLVAPKPKKLNEFLSDLALKLKRPFWLPIPQFLLNLLLSKYLKELILSNMLVKPQVLLDRGFEFR